MSQFSPKHLFNASRSNYLEIILNGILIVVIHEEIMIEHIIFLIVSILINCIPITLKY